MKRELEQLDELVDWRVAIQWGDYHGDKQPIRGAERFRCVEVTLVDGNGEAHESEGFGATLLEAMENAITTLLKSPPPR